MSAACSTSRRGWPLERVLFALAGSVTLVSSVLVAFVSPWFLLPSAFVGVNQWLFVSAGACPASYLLGHFFGLHPAPRGTGSR